jgi:membrane protein DedA with SNARE-associated domain
MIKPRTAERIASEKGMQQARELFDRWGGWLVAGSRWLPVLPETISFLAGLTRMSFWRYVVALACGAVPLGFAFATAGHLGADNVLLTLTISATAPLALWLVLRPFLKPRGNRVPRK